MPKAAVTSAKNPVLKEVRRAIVRGSLTSDGLCVAEGFHLLEEALRTDCRVDVVLAAESVRTAVEGHVRALPSIRILVLPDDLFQAVSATESTQGVIALVEPKKWSLEHLFRGRAMVAVLDGVQDPGNAGAIIRAAEAFGATGLVFLKGTVSPFNPKALRASAGSIFRVPLISGLDQDLARAAFEQKRLDVYAAAPDGGRTVDQVDLKRRFALIIGSEARGVSPRLRGAAFDLRIPTLGVESLNAAVAAGILLYEARRQRRLDQ